MRINTFLYFVYCVDIYPTSVVLKSTMGISHQDLAFCKSSISGTYQHYRYFGYFNTLASLQEQVEGSAFF